MKAEEIREVVRKRENYPSNEDYVQTLLLAEIAAQLADLNEKLCGMTSSVDGRNALRTLRYEADQ